MKQWYGVASAVAVFVTLGQLDGQFLHNTNSTVPLIEYNSFPVLMYYGGTMLYYCQSYFLVFTRHGNANFVQCRNLVISIHNPYEIL